MSLTLCKGNKIITLLYNSQIFILKHSPHATLLFAIAVWYSTLVPSQPWTRAPIFLFLSLLPASLWPSPADLPGELVSLCCLP